MKDFTINELERFSGIKAHTLRTWEQRYGVFNPGRTKNNIRAYSLDEMKKALQLALLNKNGHRISDLSLFTAGEIQTMLNQLSNEEDLHQLAIMKLLVHMYAMDTEAFELVLDHCYLNWKPEIIFKEIFLPFLIKTKLLWHGRRLDEEHFVVTAIRKKIMTALEHIKNMETTNKTVLLFLPDQNQLDFVLLYASYLLKMKGMKVLYMGNNISFANLKTYIQTAKPDFLYTYLPGKNNFPFSAFSHYLNENLPNSKLIITTYPDNTWNDTYNNIINMDVEIAMNSISA